MAADTAANRALSPEIISQRLFTKRSISQKAFFTDASTIIFNGEAGSVLRYLAKHGLQVDCVVTSPPFYGQRDYEVEGQIGLEKHPREFIKRLVEIFECCRPILRDTGSIFVNLGDTYWSGKGAAKGPDKKQPARRFGVRPQDLPGDGVWTKPKQLLLIPHRFAIAMQDKGWLVRNDNVWKKPNPVPDPVRDRSSASKEYVFHFTKARWYYYNRLAVGRKTQSGSVVPPTDVWEVPSSRGSGGVHRASFSNELVRLPIMAATPPGGVVLDLFMGSGTSLVFAKTQGFRSIGIDIKREYCEYAREAVSKVGAFSA